MVFKRAFTRQAGLARKGVAAAAFGVAALLLASACSSRPHDEGGGGSGGETGSGAMGGARAGGNGGPKVELPQECRDGERVHGGRSPLRRLNGREWNNTIRDLLGDTRDLGNQFPPDELADGLGLFSNNGDFLRLDDLRVERYADAAADVASKAAANASNLLGCDPGTRASCISDFVKAFGRRAFRRPLEDDEVKRLVRLYETEKTASNASEALSLLLEAFLNSPHFLYRIEIDGEGPRPFSSYEMASRLSYFLWQSTPDDALLDAAAEGRLDAADGVSKEVRRLLEDPRAKKMVASFHTEWLELYRIQSAFKTAPEWTSKLQTSLYAETTAFLDNFFWNDGKLGTLFRAQHTFVDDVAGAFYGLEGGRAGTPTRVDLPDDGRRRGVLTQALFQAAHSYTDQSSPIHRGKFIREQILCQKPPPPPPNVVVEPPKVDPSKPTRERFAQHAEDPTCAGCHSLMDPLGLAFEHFDALGRWRDKDGTFDIDARGEIVGTDDIDGTFDGAIELTETLASSRHVQDCVMTQWYRFALGRGEDASGADRCNLERLKRSFAESDRDLARLVVDIALSDAFRNLQTPEAP